MKFFLYKSNDSSIISGIFCIFYTAINKNLTKNSKHIEKIKMFFIGMRGVNLLITGNHWHWVHWSTDDTGTPTFTGTDVSNMSVNIGVPVSSVLHWIHCRWFQCQFFQYLHRHRASLVRYRKQLQFWFSLCLIPAALDGTKS